MRMALLFTAELRKMQKTISQMVVRFTLKLDTSKVKVFLRFFKKHFPEKRVRTLKDQFGQDRMVVVDDGQD